MVEFCLHVFEAQPNMLKNLLLKFLQLLLKVVRVTPVVPKIKLELTACMARALTLVLYL